MGMNRGHLLAGLLGLSLTTTPVLADQPQQQLTTHEGGATDPFSLDLDSLLNLKVTTASKFSEKLSEAPSMMSVVTRDELQRFGGLTLHEILERVSGLTSSTSNFSDRSLVAVRGDQTRTNEGHVLILINGRPVREILEGGVGSDILESFPVGVLERIEVIKGPGSVLYGSGAFSGVINLITKKGAGNGFRLRGAGGGAAAASGEMTFQRGNLSVIGAGQFHQMRLWATNYTYVDARVPEEQRADATSTQSLALRDSGEGGYLGVNYKGLSFMSSYTAWESPSFLQGMVGDVHWKRGFADLGYAFKANEKWEMNFNLTFSRATLDTPEFPSIHRDSNEAVLEWTNFAVLSDRDRVTFGILYNHIQGTETYFGVTPAEVISQGGRSGSAFYAQHEHRLTDDLKLIGGFQANKIGAIDLDLVPRAGIVWNPTSHFTVKALYGGAFRAPSLDETKLNHPFLQGNPNLVPEKVGTFDIGASYQGNRVQGGVNYFRSRQTSRIVEDPTFDPSRYVNQGTVTFKGVEAEGKYYFKQDWFLMGSMLFQTNTDGTGNNNLTPVPDAGAKAGISYSGKNGWIASVFDLYRGHLDGYSVTLNPPTAANHLLNSHVRLDLSKHWLKDASKGFALFAHGDNLTNRQVWLPAWNNGTGQTIPGRRGRTLYFGLEVWLKAE